MSESCGRSSSRTVWMEPEVERERTGEKELLYLDRLIFAPRPTVFAALVRSSSADHSESKPSPVPPLQLSTLRSQP